jgi:hypothetical protein
MAMDLVTAGRIIRRRWLVVLPTLALVAGLAFHFVSDKAPQYQATGATLLLPPVVNAPGSTRVNPYAVADGALLTTATAMQEILGQPAIQRELEAQSLSTDYSVTLAQSNSASAAPILRIQATAESPQVAIASVTALQQALDQQLSARQDAVGVVPSNRIIVQNIAVPSSAQEQLAARNRLIFAFAAVGLAAALAVAFLTESVVRGRRRDRVEQEPEPHEVRLPGPNGAGRPDNETAAPVVQTDELVSNGRGPKPGPGQEAREHSQDGTTDTREGTPCPPEQLPDQVRSAR